MVAYITTGTSVHARFILRTPCTERRGVLGLDDDFSARDLMSRGAVPIVGDTLASQHLAGAALLGELRDSLSELGLVERAGARDRARDLSADEAIAEFDRALSSQVASSHTAKMYRWAARDFLSTVGKSPGAITKADLEEYLQSCRSKRDYSPATVHLLVHALRRFFSSLGLKTAAPLKAPRTPPSLPRFLKELEVRQLLRACAGDPRAYAIVSVLAYSGLRVGELCRLDVQDLDVDAGELLVRSGKGGKDRLVILDPAAVRAVQRHLRTRRSGLVFPLCPARVEEIVRQAAERAGLSNRVTPHVLRHTLATSLLRRGCDIRFIQEQLGHASVATTQIYAHVDLAGLRSAYSRARPSFEPGRGEKP